MSGPRARLQRRHEVPTGYPTTALVAYFDMMVDNLLLQSETFSNASWTKTRSYITANCAADPVSGQFTVDKLVEDGTAANSHWMSQTYATVAGTYTYTQRMKSSGRTWVYISTNDGGVKGAYFQLSGAGTVGTVVGTGVAGSVTRVGSTDYYDVVLVLTLLAASTVFYTFIGEADNDNSYSGLGHQGTAAAGGSTGMAVLAAGASAVDDVYSHYFSAAAANKNLVWPRAASDFSNGWASGWAGSGAGVTITYDATNGVGNGPCISVATTDAGGAAVTPTASPPDAAVVAGSVYSFSISAKGAAGGETIDLRLSWYTSAREFIGTDTSGAKTLTSGPPTHERYSLDNVTAPANAAFARLWVRQSGATARTFFIDEIQLEQAAAATAYLTPTQGALWSDAGSKGTFSDAPTVESSGTSYNGNTKQYTFTPARASVPDGTTYTVGPGILIARAQLNPGTSARDYQVNTDLQTLGSLYNKTPTAQRGTTAGAEASDGSFGANGWNGVTDDILLGSALADGTMAGPFDIPLVGLFNGTAGTIVSLAATGVTTHYQRVAYNGSGQIRIGSKAGAGAETFSADLAVSTADILALRFRSDGTTLTLTNHATGTSVTLASQSPTGACRLGIGCTAGSTVADIASAITATLGTLHGSQLSTATWTRAYRSLKARAARKGVVVLP